MCLFFPDFVGGVQNIYEESALRRPALCAIFSFVKTRPLEGHEREQTETQTKATSRFLRMPPLAQLAILADYI